MPSDKAPPVLVRPVPRRPFSLNLTSATPPDDGPSSQEVPPALDDLFPGPRFFDHPSQNGLSGTPSEPPSGTISRAQSIMNLTSSTLFGIYGPTVTAPGKGFVVDRDDLGTPWGTGAESPGQRPSLHGLDQDQDQERAEALERLRERLAVASRSCGHTDIATDAGAAGRPASLPGEPLRDEHPPVLSLAAKAALLFALGVGYGMLVARLRDERVSVGSPQPPHQQQSSSLFLMAKDSHDRRYVAFWGISGVILGSLLPWFDHFWDQTFGGPERTTCSNDEPVAGSKTHPTSETDWALVIRGVGAFAGIVFAIRKLPWASTMQVSLTLALVNPFLWYLIDRSKSGFMLATAVGLVGAAVIAGLDPDMMPTPTGARSGRPQYSGLGPNASPAGQLVRHATIETGIWMLSVLFCSCVCFGNIGRRLSLSTSASARGRWGGVR